MPCKYFHCKWLVRKRNTRKKTHKKTQNTKTQKKKTTKCTLSFYWNIFHLQCWVSFRCATKLFKYAYIYICKYGASQVAQWENKSTCQCRRGKFDPCIGKITWRRKWQPIPVFLPGESNGQRSLAGYRLWGLKSWTQLSNQTTITTTFRVWGSGIARPGKILPRFPGKYFYILALLALVTHSWAGFL